MRALALALVPIALFPFASPRQEDGGPLRDQQRFELEVRYWEGGFGSYLQPGEGRRLVLDLARLGEHGLLTIDGDPGLGFDLGFLEVARDTTEGDAEHGWTRIVVLKGRRSADSPDKTVLELVARHEVERFEERDGKRIRLSDDVTNVNLRIHTVRDDDTLQEFGRARSYHDRDAGVRIPEPRK
jgi:hypothetical protein